MLYCDTARTLSSLITVATTATVLWWWWWCECAAFHFNWDWFTKNMTMAASALSSIINQPHIKLHSPSCFTTLRFFKHINKPLSSTSSPRPLHHITASRTFSISNKSSEQPSLRHFVARASLTASQLQPQWVLIAISVFCFLIIYHNLLQFQWKIKKIIYF
jgi:hypothetical protein